MDDTILSPDIRPQDAAVSSAGIVRLRSCITGGDRSLVFFVGAGASVAGNTQMPTTPGLLQQILLDALKRSGGLDAQNDSLVAAIGEISTRIGFETT
ncbi:MAG: hypothetical protein FJ026_11815 [Chloroflexi bacterium]|nr:hypothetical protein [Chloroflexota bacterium]